MDIVGSFKKYLLTQKNPSSSITVKNYLSDVRRFLEWYKKTYQSEFYAENFISSVISAYEAYTRSKSYDSSLPAASSAKRYMSSLRKFGTFLEHSGAIKINPFSQINTPEPQEIRDPFSI